MEDKYQEKLTKDEIKQKLKDYIPVEDITKLPVGIHIRYFSINPKTKEKKFRTGGFVSRIDSKYRYIILRNDINKSWSVQLKDSILFQKMTSEEIRDQIKDQLKQKYGKYKEQVKILKEENRKLKETIKEIKKQIK